MAQALSRISSAMARTHDHAADIVLQEYGTVTLLSVARPSRVLRRVGAGSIKGDVRRKIPLLRA